MDFFLVKRDTVQWNTIFIVKLFDTQCFWFSHQGQKRINSSQFPLLNMPRKVGHEKSKEALDEYQQP